MKIYQGKKGVYISHNPKTLFFTKKALLFEILE